MSFLQINAVFPVRVQPICKIANKCTVTKGKTCQKCGKGHFAAIWKSRPQKLPVNLLQNESSLNVYFFTINSQLPHTNFIFNYVLPMEFLINSGMVMLIQLTMMYLQSLKN